MDEYVIPWWGMQGNVAFLFDKPTPQVVIDSAIFMDVNPTTSLGENAQTIDFTINGSETW